MIHSIAAQYRHPCVEHTDIASSVSSHHHLLYLNMTGDACNEAASGNEKTLQNTLSKSHDW